MSDVRAAEAEAHQLAQSLSLVKQFGYYMLSFCFVTCMKGRAALACLLE